MYVLECEDEIFIIDCGAKFADKSLLGVDLIIPELTYLEENQNKIKGLIVTHGHEDHIGGIPYMLKKVNVPIYATRFTLGLIELKLKEHKLLRETELIEINADSHLKFNQIAVTFFKTSHSIPDCLGLVFHTPEGKVVHTGDFKFDLTPVNDQVSDIHKMAELGTEGVLALISESTNAERPGLTPSENLIANQLEEEFLKATGKIFISTFASNVNRIQQIVEAATKTNRKLVLLGRSMVNVTNVAMKLGYLNVPSWMLMEPWEIKQLPPERVVILCTGSQGEPLAALSRLSTGRNRDVKVEQGDTVIFAASPIPGNEKDVSKIPNRGKGYLRKFSHNRNARFGTWVSRGFKANDYFDETEIFHSYSWGISNASYTPSFSRSGWCGKKSYLYFKKWRSSRYREWCCKTNPRHSCW